MNPKIKIMLTLAVFMFSVPSLAGAGNNKATSPVGAWTVQYVDDDGPEGDNTTLQLIQYGGTVTGAAWTDAVTNTGGSWKKIPGNQYVATFYVMIPEAGYIKVIQEFRMLNKDEMEGREESWWVPGPDPLGSQLPGDPLWTGDLFFRRVPAEPKQAP